MADSDEVKESCGIFAVFGHPDAAQLTYYGLFALQHRGQESAGIATTGGNKVICHKGMGLVNEIFSGETLNKLRNPAALGHVRYSTTGISTLTNAQPLVIDYNRGKLAIAHNGNLTNSPELRHRYESRGSIFQSTSDSEIIVHILAEPSKLSNRDNYIRCLNEVEGAFSLVFLVPNELIVARDPNGLRPLSLGKLEGAYVISSETCALDLVGAKFIRDIEPGEILFANTGGLESRHYCEKSKIEPKHCIFEYIYFSRPDSILFGENVHEVRKRLGACLAKKDKVKGDLVFGIPDSGYSAAIGYSHQSGIPFERGFVRNHYIGRTFIQPNQIQRDVGVKVKLNVISNVIAGKKVIAVDDSIIRGTTARNRITALRKAGAEEVHMRISCPPHKFPCFYGIDFPTKTELIAAKRSPQEIAEFIGVDSLEYVTKEEMLSCLSKPAHNYCIACFDGNYPVRISDGLTKFSLER
ncbi:MAG: amidophosphoribosyltransferase [Planctomycetota bacterium]